jgi:peroxiredoxin Q/BCP
MAAPGRLEAGDRAPAFRIAIDDGSGAPASVSLARLKGTPFVAYFYPKDDTSGCTKEAVAFSAAAAKFKARGVTILGISKDSLAAHAKFRAKHKLTIPLGSDEALEMAKAWGVWIEKSLYGRKYMGMERATFLVDRRGRIVVAWHNVKVPGHVEAVLAAVKDNGAML